MREMYEDMIDTKVIDRVEEMKATLSQLGHVENDLRNKIRTVLTTASNGCLLCHILCCRLAHEHKCAKALGPESQVKRM
jgi:hypothetical protein